MTEKESWPEKRGDRKNEVVGKDRCPEKGGGRKR